MMDNFICKKVNSLLSAYIKGDLDEIQQKFISEHIKKCPTCKNSYLHLQKLILHLKQDYDESIKSTISVLFNAEKNENYFENLSAYCDNELPFEESVKFKKYLIKLPVARQELKNLCILREILKKHRAETVKKFNKDFSKNVIHSLYGKHYKYKFFPQKKLAVLFLIALFIVTTVCGLVFFSYKNTKFIDLNKNISERSILSTSIGKDK